MAGLIPENILDDILTRINIVEIISGYIPLKRAGRNFKACCPFHHEKTASFVVSPERQIYNCFGCGESGNAFKFLMRYERMDFPEAVEALARKVGVILPQSEPIDSKAQGLVTELFKINELAAQFYCANLDSSYGVGPKDYLLKRGILPETIKALKIGFALDKWDSLINHLRGKGFSLDILEKAGLVVSRDAGGYYDRFRNRIVFPVFDIKGRVLGFGARVLDNSLPKYINSPETLVYTKGRNLYGLNLAKESIRENDFVGVVEGYMDFILPYQEGVKSIVASQGTALTIEQIRLLKRYTNNVVMIYDPDSAGELAALRSLDIFIEEEVNVKIVSLPKGFDPDSFVRKNGIEGFRKEIENAANLFDYKLSVLKSRYDIKDIANKAKVSAFMFETINKFKNAILRAEYLKKLSFELNVNEEALLEESKKGSKDKFRAAPQVNNKMKPLNISPTEKLLMSLMLEESSLINRIKDNFDPQDFKDERISRIVSVMFSLLEQGKEVKPQSLVNYLGDDISYLICGSEFLPEDMSLEHKERLVDDCLKRLKKDKAKVKREKLHEEIKVAQQSGEEGTLNRLIEEFHSLIKKSE
ncbi:MAG: DNA primase [Candidatus Omnitrophota bacterium]|jgi:DNA primase